MKLALLIATVTALVCLPALGYCDVQSMLQSAQDKMTNVILPSISILGVAWAGLAMITGNPNGRTYLTFACFGVLIGFGAPAIVSFFRGMAY